MLPFPNKKTSRIYGVRRGQIQLLCIWTIPVCLGWVSSSHAQPPSKSATNAASNSTESPTGASRGISSQPNFANISTSNPKSIYVAVTQAEIYSGPSSDYYPTGRVLRGMALEAYHRTDDGWLGIRPPEGSFSWVPATDAYLLPGGRVIEITSPHAVSWIGSSLGSAKQYRWQVELRPGEQLAVLGETTNKSEAGQESLWYKIGPPAGEFRWIQEKAVSVTAVAPAEQQISIPVKSDVSVAAHQKRTNSKQVQVTGQEVQAADFSEDVFADGAVVYDNAGMQAHEGQVIYSDDYEGSEYYAGDYYGEGSYVDSGEVVYDAPGLTRQGNGWDGWHAMELTDEGFRIPFLERRYQQAKARSHVDPLNHDPFSLSMPGKISEPRSVRQDVRQNVGVAPDRRFTPWRDPRDLRSRRMLDNSGNRFSATGSTEASAGKFADREPQAGDSPASADELLGRLVSAVKNAIPQNEPIERNESTGESNAKEKSWYGVDAMAKTAEHPGVNSLELGQLQLLLSEMVAQPMNGWNLQPLMGRAKHFVEHGASAIERGQARLMLERIEEFDQLAKKSGFSGLMPVLTASATVANGSASLPATPSIANAAYESVTNPNNSNQGIYDATGWLVPVRTAAVGQPTHAITNDTGQVIAYVSGLPGMNLDVYINQAVGISGLRGYLPQLQSQHIQAHRVVRLR